MGNDRLYLLAARRLDNRRLDLGQFHAAVAGGVGLATGEVEQLPERAEIARQGPILEKSLNQIRMAPITLRR